MVCMRLFPLFNSILRTALDADGKKIVNLGSPTQDSDAATKKYVDDKQQTIVLDDTVTETSSNGVKSSGIWSWVKSLLPHWLTSNYAEPATVASVANKRDNDDLAVYKLVKSAFVLHKDGLTDVTLPFIGKDQGKPYPYSEYDWVYPIGETTAFHAIVFSDGQWKLNVADGAEYVYSPASEDALRIEFDNGYVATRSSIISTIPVDNQKLSVVATGDAQTPANGDLVKYDATNDRFVSATAGTDYRDPQDNTCHKTEYVYTCDPESHGGQKYRIVHDDEVSIDWFLYLGNSRVGVSSEDSGVIYDEVNGQNVAYTRSAVCSNGKRFVTEDVAAKQSDIKIKANSSAFAPEYDATSAYSVGAIVCHDGNIYQCKTAITEGGEAWNAGHWELKKLYDLLSVKADKSQLDALDDKRGKDNLAVYEVVRTENTDWTWTSENKELADELNAKGTKPVWIAEEGFWDDVSPLPESFIFNGGDFSSGRDSLVVTIKFANGSDDNISATATRPRYMDETLGSAKTNQQLAAVATGDAQTPANGDLVKYDAANDRFVKAVAGEDYIPLVEDANNNKTAVTIGDRTRDKPIGPFSIANGTFVTASEYYSHAEGSDTVASGVTSHAEGLLTIADGQSSHAEGRSTAAYGNYSHTEGCYSKTRKNDDYAFAWNGDDTKTKESPYISNGPGTFNINPAGGPAGFWIGGQTLPQVINAAIAGKANLESLALEYISTSAYSVGAIVCHEGNIYQCKTAIPEGGEAWNAEHWDLRKLDDFFTESNSLLNGRLAYSRNETGLKDRAFNTLSFDGTEYNLSTALAAVTPTASGQPRDLLIVATATAATTISFTAGTIKGDKPTIDGSGTWLITLTEYASGVWYCRQIKMEDAA